MSEINIRVEPGQQIEINGRRYEAVAFRCPDTQELFLASHGRVSAWPSIPSEPQPRLILRPLPVRKVPTDQDAAVWPRRKCFFKHFDRDGWCDGELLAVDTRETCEHKFLVSCKENELLMWAQFCEIEVEE